MFTHSNVQVSHTFTIIGLIAESTLKFINDIRNKIIGNLINFDKELLFLATKKSYFILMESSTNKSMESL